LLALDAVRGKSTANSVELVGMLVGSSQAVAASAPSDTAIRSARTFNRALLARCFAHGRAETALAAPAAASGIHVNLFEMLAYDAVTSGVPEEPAALAAAVWKSLAARGESLRKEGVPITDPAENTAILHREIATVLQDSVPIWRRLGVL
jgi:hypothetical protein